MAWQFLLSDLNGNTLGEITGASARKVALPHLRVPSASFTVPIYHYLAPTLLDTDTLLRCYRIDNVTGARTLAFHGPVISAEENSEGSAQSIAVTAAGPFWRLTKRLIPASKLKAGSQYGNAAVAAVAAVAGTSTTPAVTAVAAVPETLFDLGTIARSIIADTNAAHFTGIDERISAGSQHTNSRNGWAGKWYLKNVGEAIAELATGLGSFEHRVRPIEATAYASTQGWPAIGLFDVSPNIGVTRPDAVFEYGTTRANVSSYTRPITRDAMLNNALISVSGWPDSVEKVVGSGDPGTDKYNLRERGDAASQAARGLFEEVVGDAGVLDDGLRDTIADYHVTVRKQPREVITFKPSTNARPAPFIDYEVGDVVRARALVAGTLRFDALFRIWGVTFDIDENGNESVDLELVKP